MLAGKRSAIFFCVAIMLPSISAAQAGGTASAQPAQASTKIESLLMSRGSMITKDFFPVGKLAGGIGGGSADFDALIVGRVGGQTVLKGLRIEVKEGGRLERSNTSLLDLDEIEDLAKAIEYFSSPASQTTPAGEAVGGETPHREVTFSTKGGFSLTCFGEAAKQSCAVQSGSIGSTSIYIGGTQLAELRKVVDRARTALK